MGAAAQDDQELERRLAHAREGEPRLSDKAMQAMWSRVRSETTAAPRGLVARLREQPTVVRVLLAMGVAMLVSAVLALSIGPREDFAEVTVVRYVVAMSGLAVLALASFAVSLRGVHRRPLGPWAWVVIGLTLVVPFVLAAIPSIWVPAGVVIEPTDTGYGCTALGILTGGLISVPAFLMQRASVPAVARACAAVAAGGVVAFGLLELHCPSRDVTHLVVGHAAVGAALVAGCAAVVWWRRRSAG